MEIVLFILVWIVVGILISFIKYLCSTPNCQICDAPFTDKSKRYDAIIDGSKKVICARCNRKLIAKRSDENFRKYFDQSSNKNQLNNGQDRTISAKTKMAVWQRDMGKCVECGSNEKLEFDHIIPVSKGGSNTMRNIQLLCERCNRAKSNKIQ